MGVYAIKPAFQRRLRPVEAFLVQRDVHPDVLTAGAVALSVAGGVALVAAPDHRLLFLTLPFVAGARTALNALDGMVARGTHRARPWGEVLNELGDRISDVALFGAPIVAGLVPGALGAFVLAAVLIGSFVGVVAKSAGAGRQLGGVLGKPDRMLLLAVAGVVAAFVDPRAVFVALFWVVLAGSLVTAGQRLASTHAKLSRVAGEVRHA